jgi:hypothetical protein
LTGPYGADAAAQRMRSIVMKAPGPAGGVARLCATPFAAGQALALRRRPPAIDRACCVACSGVQPHANWRRACPPIRYASGATVIQRGS